MSIDNERIQRALTSVTKFNAEDVQVKVEADDYFVANSYTTIPDSNVDNDSVKISFLEIDNDYDIKDLRDEESEQSSDIRKICKICGKVFKHRHAMVAHVIKYHKNSYDCHDCAEKGEQKTFKIRAKLEEHMHQEHLNIIDDNNDFSSYYECKDCLTSFLEFEDLRMHLLFVHDKEGIRENYNRIKNSSNRVGGKVTKHKNSIKFMCDICEQTGIKNEYNVKAHLQEHILVEHLGADDKAMKYFDCEKCNESFIYFDEYQTHLFYSHDKVINERRKSNDYEILKLKTNAKKYSCEICSMEFFKENRLFDHMKKTHNIGFKCLKCNLNFKTKKELIFHNNIHVDYVRVLSEDVEMKYECILCGFKSSIENELYQHLPSHLSDFAENVNRILVCNNCSTIIKDYDALHSHLGVHNEKVTHECLKCNGRRFPMGVRLLRHLNKHKINEKLKCDYENCTFTCATRPQMKDHVKHKHYKEVVHLCATCGASFGQPGSLRNHIKNIHEKNNFIYQCSMCPMTFRVPSHLRNHQAVHTTEYNFKCEFPGCTKAFRAKRNLKLHQRFHNRSQLNYKFPCEFCDRMFLTRDAVRRHSYTHTKVKPFICNFTGCDRAFSQSNDLNKHLRTHYQQEETYFCSYQNCKQSFRLKTELRYHEGLHYQNRDPPPTSPTPSNNN